MTTTLIVGGARSGKSRYAQEMAAKATGDILFVATAEAGDDEMEARIANHRKSRPETWRTLEATTDTGNEISRHIGAARTVIIDCITLLVNNVFERHSGMDEAFIENAVKDEINGLINCFDKLDADFIVVSNEIGLGLVPADRVSRLYRDLLGRANQVLGARADEVLLLVAGIPVTVKR